MISEKDIRQVSFDRTLHGYRCEDVDSFLQQVADTMQEMQTEKLLLEKKVQALNLQLQTYKDDEDTLKTAMINAQRMAENITREARQNADAIMREARIQVSTVQEEADLRKSEGEATLRNLQREVATFKNEVLQLYKQHIVSLSSLPDLNEAGDPVPSADAPAAAPTVPQHAKPQSAPTQTFAAPTPLSLHIMEDDLKGGATAPVDPEYPMMNAQRKQRTSLLYDQDADTLEDGDTTLLPPEPAAAPVASAAPATAQEDLQKTVAYKPLTFGQSQFVPIHSDAAPAAPAQAPQTGSSDFTQYSGFSFDD